MKLAWTFCALYACVILALTSAPGDELTFITQFGVSDLILHAVMYIPLALLVFRALAITYPNVSLARRWLYAVLICSAFGAFDELHQLPIPGRFCQFPDWVADTVGVLLGATGSLLYARFTRCASEVTAPQRRAAEHGDHADLT